MRSYLSRVLTTAAFSVIFLAFGDNALKLFSSSQLAAFETAKTRISLHPSCSVPAHPHGSTSKRSGLATCITGEAFHIDGPKLIRFVTEYVCTSPNKRPSMNLAVNPPYLASALNKLAKARLQYGNLPVNDRNYVQPLVDSYRKIVSRGSQIYLRILRDVVVILEEQKTKKLYKHARSEIMRKSLFLPSVCDVHRSDLGPGTVIVLAYDALQKFSFLHWRDATNTIARANRTMDVAAAKLRIPPFVLSANIVDSVARVYGEAPPQNGFYPNSFAEIDVVADSTSYSRFAVPIEELPLAAMLFLRRQGAAIRSQVRNFIDKIDDGNQNKIVLVEGKPGSSRDFSNIFWAEHVIWQLAFREVLSKKGLGLQPSQFDTYGLH